MAAALKGRVQCWRCGIFYLESLPHCPSGMLGCGAPKLFVEELEQIGDVEVAAAELLGRLARLYNRARTSGSTGLMFATSRARNHARQALEATARLRDALRNDGGGDDDDGKGAA